MIVFWADLSEEAIAFFTSLKGAIWQKQFRKLCSNWIIIKCSNTNVSENNDKSRYSDKIIKRRSEA